MATLRIAAVQVESHDGEIAANLARAEPFVAEAAAGGAQLVLCPEFLAAGYVYELNLKALKAADGTPLLNNLVCYTANRLQDGSVAPIPRPAPTGLLEPRRPLPA